MRVQGSKESDGSQGAGSARSDDPCEPGGHLAGDRVLLRLESGERNHTVSLNETLAPRGKAPGGAPRGCSYHRVFVRGCSRCAGAGDFEPPAGAAPPIGAFRTRGGVRGYIDPDGPAPVHPRSCRGDGECIHCVAAQHWQVCQNIKAASAHTSAPKSTPKPAPPPPAKPQPTGGRRWRRRRRARGAES